MAMTRSELWYYSQKLIQQCKIQVKQYQHGSEPAPEQVSDLLNEVDKLRALFRSSSEFKQEFGVYLDLGQWFMCLKDWRDMNGC